MIANPSSLATLQAEWRGVLRMRQRMRHLALSTFAFDMIKSFALGDILYNVPFLLGFEVLKQTLLHAKEEGLFTGSGHQLDDLLENAKTALPWIDWEGFARGGEAAK